MVGRRAAAAKADDAVKTKKTAAPKVAESSSRAGSRKRKAAEEPEVAEPATTKKPRVVKQPVASKSSKADAKEARSADKGKKVAEKKTKEPAKGKEKVEKPKKTVAKKTAAPKKAVAKKVAPVQKEASEEVEEDEERATSEEPETEEPAPVKAKPARKAAAPKVEAPKRLISALSRSINDAPKASLDIFVFGEGSSGELGLGATKYDGKKKPIDVQRPRINHNLKADKVGLVQISCGGMHAIGLDKNGRVWTWGVNDEGALGRDTAWDGGLVDVDKAGDDSDSEDDDSGLNPRESIPAMVDDKYFGPGVQITGVAACDSASFAITSTGHVFGWGTFRSSDGILGFSEDSRIQQRPVLIKELKKIVSLATGSHHVLALNQTGQVFAWGCGQQGQLGRRIIERTKLKALQPMGVGIPTRKSASGKKTTVVAIAAGSYHSFALCDDGVVYGWGLNTFSELGIENATDDDEASNLIQPKIVESLADLEIVAIDGGEHHSVAVSKDGKIYTWGRIDGHQLGHAPSIYNKENSVYDDRDVARILFKPTALTDLPTITGCAVGTDSSFAITETGRVYSWGFSANYQTGLGTTDDVETPTLMDNSAIRERKIIFAGAGGQYGVVAAEAADQE